MESEFFGHVKGSFTGAVSNKIGLFEAANEGTIFLDEILTTIESAYLTKAMTVANGNKKQAAEDLNLSLRSLRYRIDKND
jgi:two-component system response regulator PilR (NtrC family)